MTARTAMLRIVRRWKCRFRSSSTVLADWTQDAVASGAPSNVHFRSHQSRHQVGAIERPSGAGEN
jgi:hypothetical protein